VLPVSVIAVCPEEDPEEAAAVADELEELDEPELPHAASRASGTTAAAAHTVRIRLATEECSFVSAR
jgi:hypothetical protein